MTGGAQKIQCDIAIIGGGSGGLSLASAASQLGLRVVLVESHKMGGDCLNYGCVPSKALLAAAKQSRDFVEAMTHVQNVIAAISPHDSVERFESLGVQVIKGHASFTSKRTLCVGEQTVQAKYFVIASGSSPFVPPIPGLLDVAYETNETIFSLQKCPKHLMVIGGGPIGCELAEAFAMLGSEVTIIEAMDMLPHDDKDCVDIVRNQFKVMNINLYEQAQVKAIAKKNRQIMLTIEKEGAQVEIKGSHVLVATGRKANIEHLGLEKADISFSPKGITANSRLKTTNPRVYAIGDVVGPYQFTHVANYHAGIVLKNIAFKWPAKVDYRAIPWVTYTTPELAHVGAPDAVATHKDAQTLAYSFAENDRAQAEGAQNGMIKVVVTPKGKILAVTIVGKNAGELILPWAMCIREKKTLRAFTDVTVPYPTLSEVSKQIASQFYAPKLFSTSVKRILKWLI